LILRILFPICHADEGSILSRQNKSCEPEKMLPSSA
jgi:hypothetical protein